MFGNKKSVSPQNNALAETIIGKGTKITGGSMTGESSVRIDGEFFGLIDVTGDLILGEEGRIEGDINVRNAMIAGQARSGLVVCADSLHIVSTGAVYGDIKVNSLVVDEGAVFIGNCKMNKDDAEFIGAKEIRYELPEYLDQRK
ncbi:MAG: polymer-forming cytoskeletal protein [Defluviitaleaceae bacterium]|nr:polymer-forming cytoskeletal protein [Defluviitaleaceae bacterium]